MKATVHWIEMRNYEFPKEVEKEILSTYGELSCSSVEQFILHNNVEQYEVKKETDGFEVIDIN